MSVSRIFGACSANTRLPCPRRRRTSRTRQWSATSAALLFVLILASAAFPTGEAAAQGRPTEDLAALHDRCVEFVHAHPKEGLERAKLWAQQGGGFYADHCVAMALFDLRDYAAAAEHFQTLATAMMGMPTVERAQALDQAGQAWLAAEQPDRAKAAFDAALQLNGQNADLLIDRAEAYAELKRYWDALDDLNRAIDLAPDRADAYIYRGAAYRHLDTPDLAMQDVQHGLSLAPDSPTGLLERGILRRLKGDIAGAREDWERVEKLAPDSPAEKAAAVNLAKLSEKDEKPAPAKPPEPAKPKS
jgi:tetratricopeptide (TPR) repeat protein